MKKNRKTIYITNNNALLHLEKQINQSAYITNLILNDIQTKQQQILTKHDVISIIEEYLSTNEIINHKDNNEIINSISSLLNF